MLGGMDKRPIDDILDFLVANNFNAIRVPLSVANILNSRNMTPVTSPINEDLRYKSYLEVLDELIARAAQKWILVMLDMHRLDENDDTSIMLYKSEGSSVSDGSIFANWNDTFTLIGTPRRPTTKPGKPPLPEGLVAKLLCGETARI